MRGIRRAFSRILRETIPGLFPVQISFTKERVWNGILTRRAISRRRIGG